MVEVSGNSRSVYIPGRRACPGESMARMELFLYLSSLIQQFHLLPPENEPHPSMDCNFGISHSPKPYKLRAIQRSVDKVFVN